jgi:signal transduction histidine kinase
MSLMTARAVRLLAGAVALSALFVRGAGTGADEGTTLTCASQVLTLTEEQAASGLPVRLRGVVVGEAPPVDRSFVLHDASEFIYVLADEADRWKFRRGDLVEVEGVSGAGGFAPLLHMRAGRKIGEGTLPEPRKLRAEELNAGQSDSQWVRVRGIVRQCEPNSTWAGRWRLTLAVGGLLVAVRVNSERSPADLVDAEVVVDGLFFNQHNVSRQFVRAQLYVPEGVPITTTIAAPVDPYAAPVRPVGSLLQFDRHGQVGHRLHVRGVVLHQEPDGWFWIRDGERGLRVASRQVDRLAPGDLVDVVGFPSEGGYTPRLEDAVYRKRGAETAPVATVPADRHAAIAQDSNLIALDARLIEARRSGDGIALVLDWQGMLVPATLPDSGSIPEGWKPGSTVRATGLCAVPLTDPVPAGGLLEPRSFELRLRTSDDLCVLAPPPWWTRQRVLWGLGIATAVSLAAVGAVLLIVRRRLQQQEIRRAKAEAEFSAILSERNRVAREIHDTLAQGLAAISMQLELAKNVPAGDRAGVDRCLGEAHRLVRENLAEARETIWNMRSQALETHDLAGALEGILQQLTAGRPIAVEFGVGGRRRRLAPRTENELLRLGQEAMTNAVKHAEPKRIAVSLEYGEKRVELAVTDDGIGFDPESAAAGVGRFGLVGMRERATQLGARLEITSAPGHGTRVALDTPTPD